MEINPLDWCTIAITCRPGKLGSIGEPLKEKLPSEFVIAEPISLAGVTAEPGTELTSSTGIKYAFNSAFSITEVFSVNLNWPSRVKF